RAAGLGNDARVVGNLFLLRGYQQHFHRALGLRAGAGIENLVIEIDVRDVEGDVLLRLPVNGLGELRFRHHRQADFLDDDRIAGKRGGHVFGFEGLAPENALDGGRHRTTVDDGAIDDAVGRHRFDGYSGNLEALAVWPQLHCFDGARADVEAND